MSHNDQTIVLITGANQGIGFEIAKKLGTDHHDYHIIVSGRKAQAVDIAVAKLLEAGCSVEPLLLDLTSDESIAQAAKTVGEKHGRLDVLINNAGISTENLYNPQKPYSRQAWAEMYDTNVIGTSAVTEAFLLLLEKSKRTKRIVFISTNMASMALRLDPNYSGRKADYRAYDASKAALNSLALHFANQLEDDPTWKVNLCCPGYCKTNLNNFEGFDTPQNGAINACRLATLGPDGETKTYTDRYGTVPW